ncbi:hypothetical protein BGZ51_006960 [Haplosporangium sp. Z 767]|nr:hypothetical protein BGZ50_001397 [Haplosporangium sp. Z 11]KAF9191589.1 hypothetical protein BGZ51_006960 [Haplosporangium sp. Z 767]
MAPSPSPESVNYGQDISQDQQTLQLPMQQQVKPPLAQSPISDNSAGRASPPSGFMATVRNAASKTTDILGISSGGDSSLNENGNNGLNSHADHVGQAQPFTSAAQPFRVPLDAVNTRTSDSIPQPQPQPQPSLPLTAIQPAMDSSQADPMTMEAFQPNGGYAQPHYDSQDFTDHSYMAGPGSFPETYETHGHNDVLGKDSSSSTQSNEGDDAYETSINFVYANEKRFSDFHAIFRSVPDEEKLIEDYGCALQKEILVQGRLYISENHVCFNANIFGWVTNLVIAFSEITAIEKRLTAFVIPNAISIVTTTNTKGHFFASFLSRDSAHDLLMAAWRKSFPCAANASAINNSVYLRNNRSNVTLNEDDDDTESFISARPASDSRRNRHRRSSSASQNWTADEADWDETEDMDGKSSYGQRRQGSKRAAVKKILKEPQTEGNRTGRGRSVSELPPKPTSFDNNRQETLGTKASLNFDGNTTTTKRKGTEPHSNSKSGRKHGQKSHGEVNAVASNRTPTTCKCSKDGRHYANTYMTETYPGSIQSMWNLLFESDFNKEFLTNEAMKGADVQEEPWQKSGDGALTKTTKYIKWLGMPIGPKTTKAILTDVCEHKDMDEYVTTVTTTSTPDVPSGGSFTTKCRTCITWAGPNQVQIVVTGAVEFTKSSWIKGQIEKGAAEGMATHYKELNSSIRKYIADHPKQFAGSGTGAEGNGVAAVAGHHQADTSSQGSRSRQSTAGSKTDHELNGGPDQPSVEKTDVEKRIQESTSTERSQEKTGLAGIFSSMLTPLSLGGGDGASHLALVSVLMLVMLANIYIWFQISSVASQIEKIQDSVLSQRAGPGPKAFSKKGNDGNSAFMDYTGNDERYAREQEDAMWAWLTEREERHRQLQRMNSKDWNALRKENKDAGGAAQSNDNNNNNSNDNDHTHDSSADIKDRALTEAKLQARINELQKQLETLESALNHGTKGM